MYRYKIYCDGAASKNGQINSYGGWSYIIITNNSEEDLIYSSSGAEKNATNQQMELTAALHACERAHTSLHVYDDFYSSSFEIYSDSAYLINCYKDKWWVNWESNGWLNAKKQPVANKELWEQLIPFFKNKNFSFHKVVGHSGNKWNEVVDKMAVNARILYSKN